MNSWYSKMYKVHEVARERNRREQRRLDFDRHGPDFVAKYQMSTLDHEKRMVQRELEQIRRGIHKQPRHSEKDKVKGNDVTGRLQNDDKPANVTPRKVETGHSTEENKLYEAIMFLQNNPSALVPLVSAHGESDAYLETLEKVAPALQTSEETQPFMPKYLREKGQLDKSEKSVLLEKYKFLLQRHSPAMRRNSPLLDTNRNSPLLARVHGRNAHAPDSGKGSVTSSGSKRDRKAGNDHMDGSQSHNSKDILHLAVDYPNDERTSHQTPEPTSSRSRRAKDLHELASGGMDNARDNVNRRLAARDGDQSNRRTSVSDDVKPSDDMIPKATKAATLFPSLDPEYYNPDGSLRTQHCMPSFEKRWEGAKKCRVLRTREPQEWERELSPQEIFAKDKK